MTETDAPEAVVGSHFDTLEDARREALRRRRKNASEPHIVTKVESSPYGGFIVRSIPVEFMVERRPRRNMPEHRFRYTEK